MGDEELNFTEEEARPWADDPRNQPPKTDILTIVLFGFVVLFIVLGAVIAGLSSGRSTSDAIPIQVGVLLVQ